MRFQSDKSLMEKVAEHDPRACQTFVKENMSMIYNVALRMVKNPATAEDVTQETFAKVWKYAHTFDGESKLKSWIYRITINVCYSHIKVDSSHEDIDDVVIEDNADLADTSLFKKQQAEHVRDAIYKLNENERAVLVMFYWESVKIIDIATALDMTPSAVESLLRRTRTKLKQILNDETIEDIVSSD